MNENETSERYNYVTFICTIAPSGSKGIYSTVLISLSVQVKLQSFVKTFSPFSSFFSVKSLWAAHAQGATEKKQSEKTS